VSRQDDSAHYATAEAIGRDRPQWMVLWGCYSRLFWGFPLFDTTRKMFVYAAYPEAFACRLDEAEQKFRVWPEGEGEVNDDGLFGK
jgi:hypothetical protein